MKTVHFVKKYKLNENDHFDHNRFSLDFGNDFQARLELWRTFGSWSHDKFFDLLDEMKMKWDAINNKTMGHLPEKLWWWMYHNILLPQKDNEFPEIKAQEDAISDMNITELKEYIKKLLFDDNWFGTDFILNAEFEWDHHVQENAVGDLQIRPNYSFKKLASKIHDSGSWYAEFALGELEYQLKKVAAAKAKVQFNIHRERAKEKFNWWEYAMKSAMGFFNENEYDAYFHVLGIQRGDKVTKEEVTQAYRNKSKQHHPDRGGSAEKFVEATEAKNKCLEYISIKNGK